MSGARIGIHNPAGLKVGEPGRLKNLEYVLVAGDRHNVADMTAPWLQARGWSPGLRPATDARPCSIGGPTVQTRFSRRR